MKIVEELRKRRVCNPWGFYGDQPYIWYRPYESRRMTASAWMITKRGLKLGDHWTDYDSKCILVFEKDRKETFAEAAAWASEKFGIKEWTRDPFGSYGPAEFVQRRLKEILSVPEGTDMEAHG